MFIIQKIEKLNSLGITFEDLKKHIESKFSDPSTIPVSPPSASITVSRSASFSSNEELLKKLFECKYWDDEDEDEFGTIFYVYIVFDLRFTERLISYIVFYSIYDNEGNFRYYLSNVNISSDLTYHIVDIPNKTILYTTIDKYDVIKDIFKVRGTDQLFVKSQRPDQ